MKRLHPGSKLVFGVGAPIVLAIGAMLSAALRHVPTVRPNTYVEGVAVGGLTQEAAAKRLRVWWETERRTPLTLAWPGKAVPLPKLDPDALGVVLDDAASVAQLPTESLAETAEGAVGRDDPARSDFKAAFRLASRGPVRLEKLVAAAVKASPPKFGWDGAQAYVKPEVPGYRLVAEALPAALEAAVAASGKLLVPVEEKPKRVPDAALAEITDLVSTYTTRFPARQFNRDNNIRLASQKLNGVILMPGERLSFNQTVGKRTADDGFKDAPVYKNGKHDHGIGGGICQVSSTLYNASLLGDLKIVRRSNHSLPVAYVPLGRDATVDYGEIDLVVENDESTPIAITSRYLPGSLTFRVFGKKVPGRRVKIEREGEQSWDPAVQYVTDHALKPGATRVLERGSRGHRIRTYRLVYENGKLVKREPLGTSFYHPSVRVIARNDAPAIPPPSPTVPPAGADAR